MAATKSATKTVKKATKKAAPKKASPKAAPVKKATKKATRKPKKTHPTLTAKEAVAMRDLWESSKGNGHDFGYTDDMPHIPKASRGGIIASLQEKGLITVFEPVTTEAGTVTQFEFTDVGEVMFSDFESSKELMIEGVQKEAKEKAAKEPAPAKVLTPKSWRVFGISDSLRESLKGVRDAATSQCSLRDVVTASVSEQLPALVQAITELLLDAERGSEDNPVRPIRMQIDDSTLDKLRYAANQTGIPSQRLMLACLRGTTAKK